MRSYIKPCARTLSDWITSDMLSYLELTQQNRILVARSRVFIWAGFQDYETLPGPPRPEEHPTDTPKDGERSLDNPRPVRPRSTKHPKDTPKNGKRRLNSPRPCQPRQGNPDDHCHRVKFSHHLAIRCPDVLSDDRASSERDRSLQALTICTTTLSRKYPAGCRRPDTKLPASPPWLPLPGIRSVACLVHSSCGKRTRAL